MAQDSWPDGVTSWDDTVKFAQLVFGKNVSVENYCDRLPHETDKSFLLFAKDACGAGKDLHMIGKLIEPQMAEVKKHEVSVRHNTQRPDKSQQMLSSDKPTVYYWTSQLTRAPCTCRTFFGADAHQKHVQTCSNMWKAGSTFEKLWDATLLKNYEAFPNRQLRPIWLDKSWQALWKWNDHNQGHGIDPHADKSDTYSSSDPIMSLSFGRGGVLRLGSHKGKAPTRMLFQEDGDALVMAGDFQSEFVHGVPPRSTWSQLKSLPFFTAMKEWEKCGFDTEISMHESAPPGAQHVRMNCTIRWHTTHIPGCPVRVGQGFTGVHGTQPVVTGAVRTSDDPLHTSVAAGPPANIHGTHSFLTEPFAGNPGPEQNFGGIKRSGGDTHRTQPVLTGTVRVSHSSLEKGVVACAQEPSSL